ncbi:PREDICTED: probable receptor-like protein kinase At1g80640 isoform X1 [Erythranthe guttata]|nr:PREDICTED: probable receptor-like protein kinase At1g80640 isoform X1 [Erythranthe guttata]|eukprot:XP_012844284.1 PREDICTED: probable receptor-like protein kinase At1g80640 isoform X1 [Erythranthe guttata]
MRKIIINLLLPHLHQPLLPICAFVIIIFCLFVNTAAAAGEQNSTTPFSPITEAISPAGTIQQEAAASRKPAHMGSSNKKLLIPLLIAAASIVLGGGLVFFLLFYIYYYRKSNLHKHQHSTCLSRKRSVSVMEYKTLELATDNFQESNILGSGGFGCVYKAKLQPNFYVAVKRLAAGHPDSITEFQTEVDILSKIEHPNIISLLGYSILDQTRLLVYELMPFGSLETQLHGPSRGSALTWNLRMKIALDIARGLEYLHEHCHPPVIHRDLKSSNILLDSNFNAKLSDFGLAVVDGPQKNKNNIKLSGTLGYVAPEYLLDGKLTDKSDVYAFGVVLLELLLGRKPMEKMADHCQSIVTWAMPQLTDRTKLVKIVDPAIRDTMDLKHLYQVGAVAVLCVQGEASYRPLITDILHSLVPLVPLHLGGTLRDIATISAL